MAPRREGNTLLNYCGVKNDLLEFVVDAAPSKQGRYLPEAESLLLAAKLFQNANPTTY